MASRKLTPEVEAEIRARYIAGGVTQSALAVEYGSSQPVVSKIVNGRVSDSAYYRKHEEELRERALAQFHALTPAEKLARGRAGKVQRGPLLAEDRKTYYDKLKRDVIEGYGGCCECCGNDHLPHLTLDHVNGGGNQERKVKSGRTLYTRLRREGYPRGEYRVLCFNCNFGAHLNGGECDCGLTVTRPTAVLREVI